jgi:coenzyme F420-0:L-glutamate ligase/coenzyme F420-1:gamma-L-glutamate ligase
MRKLELIGVEGMPEVKPGDNLTSLILSAVKKQKIIIKNKDIVVITHKIISKSENRLYKLKPINPKNSTFKIAKTTKKDPRLVEIIFKEAKNIIKIKRNTIIAETRHGFICANAGIDKSNIPYKDTISLLPLHPDKSAKQIRNEIKKRIKKDVAVIISDTFGRPWREGQTNIAIGISGINPIKNYIGEVDTYGYTLRSTAIAIVDELSSAAELIMGKVEYIPVVIIRGYKFINGGSIKDLIRTRKKDLFR